MKKIKIMFLSTLIMLVSCAYIHYNFLTVNAKEIELMAPAKAMIVLEGNSFGVLYSY